MQKYEIIYDYDNSALDYDGGYFEEKNIREEFTGSWDELQDYIKSMKKNGCYNIDAVALYDIEED